MWLSEAILSVLIWVQTVYIGYQQTTKVVASKERVKGTPPPERASFIWSQIREYTWFRLHSEKN